MHEASIVQSLIALAAQKTPAGRRVLEVQVALGLLTSISPDAMLFYFEALRDDSLGPQAELRVRLEPLRGRCAACSTPASLQEASWLCPACGEPRLVFENGDELDLVGLVVDDADPDHDRTEDPREERRHSPQEPPGD